MARPESASGAVEPDRRDGRHARQDATPAPSRRPTASAPARRRSPSNAIVPAVLPLGADGGQCDVGFDHDDDRSVEREVHAGRRERRARSRTTPRRARRATAAPPRPASAATSPITVAGATTAKTYTCTVRSTNAVGTGPASAASNAVVVGSPAPPTSSELELGIDDHGDRPVAACRSSPGADNGSPTHDAELHGDVHLEQRRRHGTGTSRLEPDHDRRASRPARPTRAR